MFVVRAVWSFTGETDEDLTVDENQQLYVLDASTDPDWWLCSTDITIDGPSGAQGRVPANYLEPAPEQGHAVALYAYDPQADNELRLHEDQPLHLFRCDADDWWLASTEDRGEFGWIPANYVEKCVSSSADDATRIHAPASPQAPSQTSDDWHGSSPKSPVMLVNQHLHVSLPKQRPESVASASNSLVESQHDGDLIFYAVTANLKGGKKQRARNGLFAVSATELLFVNERDKTVIQQWMLTDVTGQTKDKKHVFVEFGATTYDFAFQNKAHAEATYQAIAGGKKATSAKLLLPSKTVTSPKQQNQPAAVVVIPEDRNSYSQPSSANNRKVYAQYSYEAQQDDEVSVNENDELILIDDKDSEWSLVQTRTGAKGLVPTSYLGKEPLSVEGLSEPEPYHAATPPKLPSPVDIKPAPMSMRSSMTQSQPSPTQKSPGHEHPMVPLPPRNMQPAISIPPRNIEQPSKSPRTTDPAPLPSRISDIPLPPRTNEVTLPPRNSEIPLPPRNLEPPRNPVIPLPPRNPETPLPPRNPEISLPPRNQEPIKLPHHNTDATSFKHTEPSLPRQPDIPLPPRNPEPISLPPRSTSLDHSKQEPTILPLPPRPVPSSEEKKVQESVASTRENGGNVDVDVRTWTDKSGSFQVEARYLGMNGEKVILHKTNGVKIAVPLGKLCDSDVEYVQKKTGGMPSAVEPVEKKSKTFAFNGFDWFGFFIGCGMNVEDSERYASKFVAEKMDGASLEHLSRNVLKDLGIAEGDILRILAKTKVMTTAISAASPSPIVPKLVAETSISPSPIVDAKVAKVEKQAEKKIMEMLSRTSISKQSGDNVSASLQMQQDEALAKELQEKELKAAGLPVSALYTTMSTGSSGRRQQHTKAVSGFSAVDTQTLFDVAKKVETSNNTASTSDVLSNPSWLNDDFFNPKPVNGATSNPSPVFSSLSSKPVTSSTLQDPLVPLTSSVMPLPVKVSTGDSPKQTQPTQLQHRSSVAETNTIRPATVSVQQQPQSSIQNIPNTATAITNAQLVRPVLASAVSSVPPQRSNLQNTGSLVSSTMTSAPASSNTMVSAFPSQPLGGLNPSQTFRASVSQQPTYTMSQPSITTTSSLPQPLQGSMPMQQQPLQPMAISQQPVRSTVQHVMQPNQTPVAQPMQQSMRPALQPTFHQALTPQPSMMSMQPLRPQFSSVSNDPYAVFKETDPRAPSIFDQPQSMPNMFPGMMPPMPSVPMMPMPPMPMFQDPFAMQQQPTNPDLFSGTFSQQQPQPQQQFSNNAFPNNMNSQGRWF